MRNILLTALLLLAAGHLPLAAQTRHLPARPLGVLEQSLRSYSLRLRLPVTPPAAAPARGLSLARPGRVARYDWNPASSAWESPQVILYAYDAQGRPTQETHADSATAAFTFRLIYTRDAQGQLTEILQQDHDGSGWANSFRRTTTYDAQGNETADLGQDWISAAWTTTFGTRTTNTYTATGFLARRVVQTFQPATASFPDDYRVSYTIPASGPYTEFTVQRWSGGQWQDESRMTAIVWYDAARQLPRSLEIQIPQNTTWVSVQRLTATYQPDGSSITTTEVRPNPAGPWQNDTRTTDTYDAYANQTSLLHENWSGTAWTLNDRYQALLRYDAQHNVLRRDEQLALGTGGGQLVNQQRYNFGSFVVLAAQPGRLTLPPDWLSLFPNPARGPVTVLLTGPAAAGPATGEVRDARGQLVAAFGVYPGQPLLLPALPSGLYLVVMSTPRGRLSGKLVQQ